MTTKAANGSGTTVLVRRSISLPLSSCKKACSSTPPGFFFWVRKKKEARDPTKQKKHIIACFFLHYSKTYKIKGTYQCGKYKAPYSLESAGDDRRHQNVSMFSERGACFTRTWILLRRFAFVYQRCTDFDAAKPQKSWSCC